MKYRRILLTLGLVAALGVPAPAGIFFGKRPKPNPAERVSQLLLTLKTDSDDSKRASAAKELREFDPRAFPELVPMLIDVLKQDQKPAVRSEVVQTLSKLRPISQEAGLALEGAINDSSWRVRWQARQALLGYRMSGYRSPAKADASVPSGPAANQGSVPLKARPGLAPRETPPPPLAEPVQAAPASQTAPNGSSVPVPVGTPKLQKPPTSSSEQGPELPVGD